MALLIVDLDNISATPRHGATRSGKSFPIWKSALGLMPETWVISNTSPSCIRISSLFPFFRI
jgi:hypothetical protein